MEGGRAFVCSPAPTNVITVLSLILQRVVVCCIVKRIIALSLLLSFLCCVSTKLIYMTVQGMIQHEQSSVLKQEHLPPWGLTMEPAVEEIELVVEAGILTSCTREYVGTADEQYICACTECDVALLR